ncbi:MAG: rhodanese-like domain-containing protein [Candidatus Omnitrophica bacterium]|nr:rhodanese-like domain-containing protein [Candidatus Omnitrophota bacterium]
MNSNNKEVKEVDINQAKEMLGRDDTIIIDIRHISDYEAGNIEGSQHLTPETFKDFLELTDKTKTILCYCYHGISSLDVCETLKDHGFQNPISLKGGFSAWQTNQP